MHTQKEKHTSTHTKHTTTTTAATETSPTFFSQPHPPKKTITEVCREKKKTKTVTAEIQQQEKTPD
jgi:hypothetical protein